MPKNADARKVTRVTSPRLEHEPQIPEIKKLIESFGKIGKKPSEIGTGGWVLADEFVTGLKMAGPQFSQQKVIDALNTLTHYTANGLVQPIDWTKQHQDPFTHPEAQADKECFNYVKILKGGKSVFGANEPARPWICFNETDRNVDNPEFVRYQPGESERRPKRNSRLPDPDLEPRRRAGVDQSDRRGNELRLDLRAARSGAGTHVQDVGGVQPCVRCAGVRLGSDLLRPAGASRFSDPCRVRRRRGARRSAPRVPPRSWDLPVPEERGPDREARRLVGVTRRDPTGHQTVVRPEGGGRHARHRAEGRY